VKKIVLGLAAATGLLAAVAPADAADITPIPLKDGSTALLLTGDITSGDGEKFRSEASKYKDAFVLLESDGGSLADALEIGETIRLRGYATAVMNGSSCNSACALIWLAGSPRGLSKSGRVGFHAAYSDASGSAQESGVANAMVGRYLTLLNLPEKAVIFATTAPPTELSWLTSSNYSSTGIDVKIIDDVDWGDAGGSSATTVAPPPVITVDTRSRASSNGDPTVWDTVGSWTVYVDPTLDDGCFLAAAFDNNSVFRVGVNRDAGSPYYALLGNPAWTSLRPDGKYPVQFQFDNNAPWDVPTVGVDMGEHSIFLRANFSDSSFWTEFSNSNVLRVTRDGQFVTGISLAGSKAAFDELVRCQRAEDAKKTSRDPFAR
jgi:hypothetical protein